MVTVFNIYIFHNKLQRQKILLIFSQEVLEKTASYLFKKTR
jgi:hypothetical protein